MVTGIRDCFKNGIKSVLAVLPTGGGKTVVFTYITQKMGLKKKKVIILVHRIELLDQTSSALVEFDVEHGIINPKYTPCFIHDGQVASVQTIIRRLNYFAALNWKADAIIIDEAHHATSKSWTTIIDFFKELNPEVKIIGVTATPIRTDGQGLGVESGGIFEEMVEGPSMSWLMDNGWLVRAKVYGQPEKLDLSNIHTSGGDYKKDELSRLVDKPKIIGDAVQHYREICEGVPTLVYCVSVEHAEHVAQQFRDAGYKFYALDGNTDSEIRKRTIQGLKDGSVQGITSCDLIGEGTDIPRATCEVDLRPTQSKGLKIQHDGRVLRPVFPPGFNASAATVEERLAAIAASEKPFAIILDHVGNTERHGFSWAEQAWTLEGSVKKRGSKNQEKMVQVVMCDSCHMQQEPAAVCVGCGHVMKKPVDNTPKQVEGKLREITEADIKAVKARKEVGMAQSIEELIIVAKARGFSEKWAHHVHDGRQKKIEKLAQEQELKRIMKFGTEIPFEEITETPVVSDVVWDFEENLDF